MKRTISIAGALAAALGSMLATTTAHAATTGTCWFGTEQEGISSCTDFTIDLGDKRFTVLTSPTSGSGNVDWDIFDVAGESVWQTDIDWIGGGLVGAVAGNFYYSVEILDPRKQFDSIDLDYAFDDGRVEGASTTVTKEIFDADENLIATLNSVDGVDPADVAISGKKIFVNDSWDVGEGQALDNVVNYVRQSDVPGPLPLMGAVAALGFSRRLRRRVAAAG